MKSKSALKRAIVKAALDARMLRRQQWPCKIKVRKPLKPERIAQLKKLGKL